MQVVFKVVIPSFNSARWIERTADSILSQSYPPTAVCIVDDASTDLHHTDLVQRLCKRHGWCAHRRTENGGPLASLVAGVGQLECGPEDVIVVVDGDDWLAHPDVLAHVAQVYREGGVDITFGQYVHYPSGRIGHCCAPPSEVIADRSWRQGPMYFSHLRTFRYKLFAAIRDGDLRAPDGSYLRAAADWATMVPMLEMAGDRFRFIEEVLYVYNTENPMQLHRIAGNVQKRYRLYVRGLEKYPLGPHLVS